MPNTSIDLIDKYFAEPSTQAIIQQVEEIRQKAYNAKRVFYKTYRLRLVIIYLLIPILLYVGSLYFTLSEIGGNGMMVIILGPGVIFWMIGKSKQISLLGSKKVTTKLFDHFIKFIIPGSQFSENSNLYNGTIAESQLFISNGDSENICNSINIPLIKDKNNENMVNLEGAEVIITKKHGSGKNQTTTTYMDMLYKINFKNPKRIIKQSIKVIANNNSRLKEKTNIVNLEDKEFEEHFDVYSADPLEARMILTPNVMDKLTQFIKSTGSSYSFHFKDNIFYTKKILKNDCSIINVDRDNSIEKNKEIYKAFYNEILYIQQLVEALNIDYFNKLS